MGKATGVFLILTGIGSAALLLPAVDRDAERQLSDVVRIATGNANTAGDASVTAKSINVQQAPDLVVRETAKESQSVAAALSLKHTSAPSALLPPPQLVTKNANVAPAHSEDTTARANLARDIQRELKRVGCYDGDLSGEWNSSTRRAMKTFIDKVNAALPSDEPDHILRTMVQGHPGNACGRGGSVVAQAIPAKPSKAVDKELAQLRDLTPIQREAAVARPTVPKPTWETSIAPAPVTPLNAEGRMAMGAPLPPLGVGVVAAAEPRLQLRETSVAAAAEKTRLLPGALAALSRDQTDVGVANRKSEPSDKTEKAEKAEKPSGLPSVQRAPVRRAEPRTDQKFDREDELRRERARQVVVIRRPLPEPFKFPSYAGIQAPKYFAAQAYTDRSSFSQRFFEKQKRSGETR